MGPTHLREIKHIVVNFQRRKKTTAYRINYYSPITIALIELGIRKLIEFVDVKGFIVHLRPAKDIKIKLSTKEKQQLGI
jgi:hypothetical protein